jgi:hypothetical protein
MVIYAIPSLGCRCLYVESHGTVGCVSPSQVAAICLVVGVARLRSQRDDIDSYRDPLNVERCGT